MVRGFASIAVLAALALSACASTGGWRTGEAALCQDQLAAIDTVVEEAGTRDAQAQRLPAFPYFRINRFWASYDFEGLSPAQRTQWVEALMALDAEARLIEIANLPAARHAALKAELGAEPEAIVSRCHKVLRAEDHKTPRAHRMVGRQAEADSSYKPGWRLAGLYPLTAPFVNWGFQRWKDDNLGTFDLPAQDLPVDGELITYVPRKIWKLSPADVSALLERAAQNPLNIPLPEGEAANRLISAFAPVFEVETRSRDDLVGQPVWRDGLPDVDETQLTAFTWFSHAHWQGRTLLQINYMVWFPARPRQGSFDVLGGRLDSVVWRVTLGMDGRPLLYDSIHGCGCYHLFFPTGLLRAKETSEPGLYREGLAIASQLPRFGPGETVVLRLAAVSHYIRHVRGWEGEVATSRIYSTRPYRTLRSLPLEGGGRRSLFRPDGIVPKTHRAERWFLWPMGIESAGGMRQRGTHATAFVGERHFDDPWLIERYFDSGLQAGDAR